MTANCDPEIPASVAPLVDLHQAVVTEAVVYKDDRLAVCFRDRRVLTVPVSEQNEAFSVTDSSAGREPFQLVSAPGGASPNGFDAATL